MAHPLARVACTAEFTSRIMKKAPKNPKPIKAPPPPNLRNMLEIAVAQDWKGIHENPHDHVQRTRIVNTVIEALRRYAGTSVTYNWSMTEAKLQSRLLSRPLQKPSGVDLVGLTWDTAYPDRRSWESIGEEAREEWRRVFSIYEGYLLK